ncbi:MAG: DUF3866 family protein [Actinomycetota bacterium]|nr:DUF3866 family protein [Actinomycetota bacterium]
MATFREGTVIQVLGSDPHLIRVRVQVGEDRIQAAGFPDMLGPLDEGDRVVLNTAGIDLGLGTGGVAFVLWNLDGYEAPPDLAGHIMKMRYTPWQKNVNAVEAPESSHHETLRNTTSLKGVPVVAGSLHSQIAGVAAGIKAENPDTRVGYLMTDGAALPLAWSNLVRELKEADLIDVTATCGHAFGGDIEAVNVFSGLAALAAVGEARVIVAAMGPGVVGTGTTLGHTAIEQGQILDATTALGGNAFACLRISFADDRARHRGVSHHSLTALSLAARERCTIVVPELPAEQAEEVSEALSHPDIKGRHEIVHIDGRPGLSLLKERAVDPTSMGRSMDEVPELWLAASAAGRAATPTAVPHDFS